MAGAMAHIGTREALCALRAMNLNKVKGSTVDNHNIQLKCNIYAIYKASIEENAAMWIVWPYSATEKLYVRSSEIRVITLTLVSFIGLRDVEINTTEF